MTIRSAAVQSATDNTIRQMRIPCRVLLPRPENQEAQGDVPVTGGICFPKGRCTEASDFRMHFETSPDTRTAGGRSNSVPAQMDVLNRWSDGSIRWALASFVAPDFVSAECDAWLLQQSESAAPSPAGTTHSAVTARTTGDTIAIRLQNVTEESVSDVQVSVRPLLRDTDGHHLNLTLQPVRTELTGQQRHTLTVEGTLQDAPFVRLEIRLQVWPATGLITADACIHNSRRAKHRGGLWDLGDAGSFHFGSFDLEIASPHIGPAARLHWQTGRNERLRTEPAGAEVTVQQHSSGHRNWRSSAHVNQNHVVPLTFRGFTADCSTGTIRGYQAEPLMMLTDGEQSLSVAVLEFWQQFPTSLTAGNGRITVGLFPDASKMQSASAYELQGGERKTQTTLIHLHSASIASNILDLVCAPPRLLQPPEWYDQCRVFPWFQPQHLAAPPTDHMDRPAAVDALRRDARHASQLSGNLSRLSHYLQDATTGDACMDSRRQVIDEYGWRNFGDIPADHEDYHYKQPLTAVSHYNNQFDLIYGGILQLASTGDRRWLDLFDPLARHVVDIDIYHTTQDRASFNGGLFWHTDHYVDAQTCTHRTYSVHNTPSGGSYGGGPGNEHNYTTGLLYYYFLTGTAHARDAVISLADWVIAMDDGRRTIFGLLDEGPTGLASVTVRDDYHGPGRGAGNSLNALLDGWLLTSDAKYMQKAEELILRCVHPEQDIESLHLLEAESHWSYTIFLTALGRFVLIRNEADQRDEMYAYAVATLSHFGRWMAQHEERTLQHPEKLEHVNEAWPAQDFRKANVLQIAATCESDPRQAAAMRQRAAEINDHAWKDLYSFGDAHRTARCLSIIMTEGLRDVYHRSGPQRSVPRPDAAVPQRQWQMFVPQKTRIRQLLKSPVQLLASLPHAANPRRWWNTLIALSRQL